MKITCLTQHCPEFEEETSLEVAQSDTVAAKNRVVYAPNFMEAAKWQAKLKRDQWITDRNKVVFTKMWRYYETKSVKRR